MGQVDFTFFCLTWTPCLAPLHLLVHLAKEHSAMADHKAKAPQKTVPQHASPAPVPLARSKDKLESPPPSISSSNGSSHSNPNDADHTQYMHPANSSTKQHPFVTPSSKHAPQHILLNEPTPSPMAGGHPAASYGTPPQTPNTRRNVGRWKIGKLIGRGASGQVYMAHLIGSAKSIAVKQVRRATQTTPRRSKQALPPSSALLAHK